MKSHLLMKICCSLVIISYSLLVNNSTYAQLSENTLESIVNQTNRLTSAQISVGNNPQGILALGEAVYVANTDSNTVSVINPTTNTVIKNIAVGDGPFYIDAELGDAVYVANSGSNTVSVINPTTNTVIKNITVGDRPTFIDRMSWLSEVSITYEDAVYVANTGSNTVSVIDSTTYTGIGNITVGDRPTFISENGGYVYVVNSGSNTVSVINPTTNTVIKNITVGDRPTFIEDSGDVVYVANTGSNNVSAFKYNYGDTLIKNITVGDTPTFIEDSGDVVYVANSGSNTVSVINGTTSTVIKNITVGDTPFFISSLGNITLIANIGSNTVSVINGTTSTVIKNITVGENPNFISATDDAIYVTNSGSDTVSVINRLTNEVVAGVTFNTNPIRGGQIICNGLDAPINLHFYVSSGTECVAKPNNGFEFDSWGQIFEGNSTRTINASTTSGSPWASFLNIFGAKTNDPSANLTVNRFGNFTAYFKALPPPVPAEYVATLFTVVVTALVGSLLIPAAVGWIKTKKQTSRLNSFHQQMALVYGDGKLDENDTNQLDILNKNISDSYAAGKINNEQYMHLKNEVSTAYQKIFKKRIESIPISDTEDFRKLKKEIKDVYSDGKITELHYNLLNEQISDMLNNK